jgi:hypothetical protein
MHTPVFLRSLFLSTAAACALAACGGGSDDAPPPPAASTPTPAPIPIPSPTCPALHSGTYRVIVPQMAPAGEYATDLVRLDAVTGTTTAVADPTDVGHLTPTGTCTFSTDNGGEAVVSTGGVLVFRSVEAGVTRLGLAFPEQTIPVADLAGDWQMLGYERDDATGLYAAVAGSATINAAGRFTVTRYCPDVKNCLATVPTPTINLSANAAGGFNLVNATDNWTSRTFAYRNGSGDLMLADISGNGSVSLWTQQRTNTLPTVSSRSVSYGIWTNPSLVSANAPSLSDFTTTAVDAAAGSWTRVSNSDGHTETLFINNPHAGMSFRPEGTATTTSGATVAVREFAALSLRGMGVSVLSLPTLGGGAYFLSVTTTP